MLIVPPVLVKQTSKTATSSSQLPVENVRAVADRTFGQKCMNILEGMARSKVLASAGTTGVMALTVALAFHPVGWIAAALGISAVLAKALFTVGALLMFACTTLIAHKSSSTVTIELTAIKRLLTTAVGKTNYNEICKVNEHKICEANGHKLILGAMPSALTDYSVIHDVIGNNGTVISVNEPQEREIHGFHVPFTEKDYTEEGIAYRKIDADDFILVDQKKLHEGADAIQKGLENGNVYVHCRAGKGRSAMILAAYLIKHQNMSVEEACKLIKKNRPEAKIHDRIDGLVEFKNSLLTSKKETPSIEKIAADLAVRRSEKPNGRAKLTKAEMATFYGKKIVELWHQLEGMFQRRIHNR